MSSIEDEVALKLIRRSELGLKKYGVTMERDDLTTEQWLNHLQEELMDAAVYVERLMIEVRKHDARIKSQNQDKIIP